MVETKLESSQEPVAKKMKADVEIPSETIESNILNEFKFVKVLSESSTGKRIVVQAIKRDAGSEGQTNQDAVIIFEKPHFSMDEVNSFLDLNNEFSVDLVNDIYRRMCIYPLKPHNSSSFLNYSF